MSIDLKKTLGVQVRLARKRLGLTQEQLAGLIERSVEAVSNIERGQSLPALGTLHKLSTALEVPLRDFLDNIDENKPVSDERFELELELRELGRTLPDDGLKTLLEMGRVILKPRS